MSFLFHRLGCVILLTLRACGGTDPPIDTPSDGGELDFDAAPSWDAGLVDDAGSEDAAIEEDAAIDIPCVIATCDPRTPDVGCDAGMCLLQGESPSCAEPITILRGEDEQCFSNSECEPGLACFQRLGLGRCGRICCPTLASDPVCGENRCSRSWNLVDNTATDWGICLAPRPCDLLSPELACESTEGCYIVSQHGETDCLEAGAAESGESCEDQNDCAPGYFCAGLNLRQCVRLCALATTDSCEDDQTCTAQSYTPADVGVCVDGV